jgi:hypothetical protein
MSDPHNSTSYGADHAPYPDRRLKVAPTDGSTKFNTIRIPLVPVACWRLNDPAFGFDSSFIMPDFRRELAGLASIIVAHPGCPAAIFGHCDPVGSDALNKTLSDRRAIAVYALLTRQPALWEDLYAHPAVGDTWGTTALQWMLASVTDADGNPYYADGIDGQYGPETAGAVRRFQQDSGLSVDGQAGPSTRKVLFGAYMDWLLTPDDGPPANPPDPNTPAPDAVPTTPFRMQATDFLGGTSASQAEDLPLMSLQGCGKFNPVVLLASSELDGSDQHTRDADDAPNRRVLMFFFPAGARVDPATWPCPKVKDAGDACSSAFWPDGDQRRRNGTRLRLYQETRDTMACRFYDRFARRSPCEASQGRLYLVRLHDDDAKPISTEVPYRVTIGAGTPISSTSPDGWARLRLAKGQEPSVIHLEWGQPPREGAPFPFAQDLVVAWAHGSDQDQAIAKLNNIAYCVEERDALSSAVSQFQRDYEIAEQGLNADGTLPSETSAKLASIYGDACDATRPDEGA